MTVRSLRNPTLGDPQPIVEREIVPDTIEPDTLDVDNFNVLLFKPTESEYNELLRTNGENSGIREVDSDFGFYAKKVYDSISKTDLKVRMVTERILKYSTKNGTGYLDRLKNAEGQYGVIFNQANCDPRIEFVVMTDVEMFRELARYNKDCKRRYYVQYVQYGCTCLNQSSERAG